MTSFSRCTALNSLAYTLTVAWLWNRISNTQMKKTRCLKALTFLKVTAASGLGLDRNVKLMLYRAAWRPVCTKIPLFIDVYVTGFQITLETLALTCRSFSQPQNFVPFSPHFYRMPPSLLRSVTFVYNRTYELHFYPVDIYVRVPCVLQDWNIALCVERKCRTLLVFSLVNMKYLTLSQGGGIKETEARPCHRARARTCEIADTHSQTIQRVTFNLDSNLEKKILKVSGCRELSIYFNAGFKEKLLKTFHCIILCDQNILCSCLIELGLYV